MEIYENTLLWRKTLGKEEETYQEELKTLSEGFRAFRKNAGYLSGEIARYLPEFTVHDITHIDALWEMADIFLPDDYELTPAEGFVLGGAFILHDLGMVLAAYANGIEDIKKEPVWRDTVAALSKADGKKYDFDKDGQIDNEIAKAATEKTLRVFHAKKAKELAMISWKDGKGKDLFLIESDELRHAYGDIIGRIARSHWLSVGELKKEFPVTLGAPGNFPKEWVVDPLKLACIVRVADAMHIDDRRAPVFLRAIRKINKESELHWIFQEKLYKPRVENQRAVYTSKSPFSMDEMNAWWLCYDTLNMIDRELKSVDSLLLEEGKAPFNVQGVYGIENLEQIQKSVEVTGWKPVDTKIRVNNVARLVKIMGGAQLYGENYFVPLRELIQNAADAIRARRFLDDEGASYGDIEVIVGKDEGEHYIQVADNGLGMSPDVLSGTLLDFGQSFWGTDAMHEEFPGLEQTQFHSTGKFGIGFFSVFMWGEKVKVISNKYNQSRESTTVLEFMEGVNARPILRQAVKEEQIKNGGTVVRVQVSSEIYHEICNNGNESDFELDFDERIARICFALDCNLYLTHNGKRKQLVKANDWITMSGDKFYERLLGMKAFMELKEDYYHDIKLLQCNLKVFKENDGEIVGRACLYNNNLLFGHKSRNLYKIKGMVITDGFEASKLFNIVGVIKGETNRVARDLAIPKVTQGALDKWLTEQVDGMKRIGYKGKDQVEMAGLACTLSQCKMELKLAKWKDMYVDYYEIVDVVKRKNNYEYYLVQDVKIYSYECENEVELELADNVFVYNGRIYGIMQKNKQVFDPWPEFIQINGGKKVSGVLKQIIRAVSEAWGSDIDKVEAKAAFSDGNKENKAVIGTAEGEDVEMIVDILYKV